METQAQAKPTLEALATPVPKMDLGKAPPATEVKAEEKPPEEPKPISREYQILANREKALQKERDKIKAEKAAIAAERAQAQAELAKAKELEARYTVKPKNAREALERYGFSYKDATEYELNDGNPTPEILARQAVQTIEEFKQQQEAQRQADAARAAEAAQGQTAAILSEFEESCGEYVIENKASYELTNVFNGKLFDAKKLVYNVIAEHFQSTGKVLTIKEGADLVEKFCEELGEQYQASSKAKSKQSPVLEPKAAESAAAPKQEPKTLSNRQTASTTPTLAPSPKFEQDRMRRALAALG